MSIGLLSLLIGYAAANSGGSSTNNSGQQHQPRANAATDPAVIRRAAARRDLLKRILRASADKIKGRPTTKRRRKRAKVRRRRHIARRALQAQRTTRVVPMDKASAANAPARAAANAAARQALAKAISEHRPTAKQLRRAKAAAKIAKALKASEGGRPASAATTPRQAAAELKEFLMRTGRFGSKVDKPAQVIKAQRALGVTADGVIGPKTRRAARQWGIVLPPRA